MLIFPPKPNYQIRKYTVPIYGSGLFSFAKNSLQALFKRGLNSNLAKTAVKAVNSKLGKQVIKGVKDIAKSELGQDIQKKIVSELGQSTQKVVDKISDKIGVDTSSLGLNDVDKKVENYTEKAFQKLGITPPPPPQKKNLKRKRSGKKTQKKRKKTKGGSILFPTYKPPGISFGRGIIIED